MTASAKSFGERKRRARCFAAPYRQKRTRTWASSPRARAHRRASRLSGAPPRGGASARAGTAAPSQSGHLPPARARGPGSRERARGGVRSRRVAWSSSAQVSRPRRAVRAVRAASLSVGCQPWQPADVAGLQNLVGRRGGAHAETRGCRSTAHLWTRSSPSIDLRCAAHARSGTWLALQERCGCTGDVVPLGLPRGAFRGWSVVLVSFSAAHVSQPSLSARTPTSAFAENTNCLPAYLPVAFLFMYGVTRIYGPGDTFDDFINFKILVIGAARLRWGQVSRRRQLP